MADRRDETEPSPAPRPAPKSTVVQPAPDVPLPVPLPPASAPPTGIVRRAVAGPEEALALRGLPLGQKIMLATAGAVILTAALIFVVVYSRTVDLLDAEIDAKGVRLVQTLRAVDPGYWLAAMYQDPARRRAAADALLAELLGGDADALFREDPGLQRSLEKLLAPPGAARRGEAAVFLDDLRARAASRAPADRRAALEESIRRRLDDAAWRRRFDRLLDPAGTLRALKADGGALLEGGEIVQVSVLHVDAVGAAVASVAAYDSDMELADSVLHAQQAGVDIRDGRLVEKDGRGAERSGRRPAVRGFRLDVPHEEGRLRFYVILSLEHIAAAKRGLMLLILLPVALSVGVGLAIAAVISGRITRPVQHLLADIEAVRAGDLSHETQPRSGDEIGRLAAAFGRMTRALKVAHDQEVEARALEHDLAIAREIQSNLLPREMPPVPGVEVAAFYRPSGKVGGDYYDVFRVGADLTGFVVADVSGKGVSGSLVMAMVRALLRREAERGADASPADTLIRVNRMLAPDIKKGMFVTAAYAILDPRSGALTVSSAGHHPLFLWRSRTGRIEPVHPKGIALGFDKGPVFERTLAEERVTLESGDRVVLYTDGAVEAMNEKNEEFGDARFQELVTSLATRDSGLFLDRVVAALDAHKGRAPQHDDLTIVTLRVL